MSHFLTLSEIKNRGKTDFWYSEIWYLWGFIFAVVGLAYAVRSIIKVIFARNGDNARYIEKFHYILGIMTFCIWLVILGLRDAVLAPEEAAYSVIVIFWGHYAFDLLTITSHWSILKPTFRMFYLCHHTLALLGITTWRMLVGDAALNILYTYSFVIWLSPTLILYPIQLARFYFRGIWTLRIHATVFVIQRFCRIGSYIFSAVAIKNWGFTEWMLLLIALIMDVFDMAVDVYFMWTRLKRQRKRALSHKVAAEHAAALEAGAKEGFVDERENVLHEADMEKRPLLEQ